MHMLKDIKTSGATAPDNDTFTVESPLEQVQAPCAKERPRPMPPMPLLMLGFTRGARVNHANLLILTWQNNIVFSLVHRAQANPPISLLEVAAPLAKGL